MTAGGRFRGRGRGCRWFAADQAGHCLFQVGDTGGGLAGATGGGVLVRLGLGAAGASLHERRFQLGRRRTGLGAGGDQPFGLRLGAAGGLGGAFGGGAEGLRLGAGVADHGLHGEEAA